MAAKKAAPKAADSKSNGGAAEKSSTSRPKSATKGEVFTQIADKTGLPKKDVAKVFDSLSELIGKELGKKGPGAFVVPGLLKLQVIRKPATKARPGKNPFTGEPMTIKAKPARNVIRARPLKALKDLV